MSAVVIDDHHGDYYCPTCDRGFNSAAAVYQHCEDTTLHSWCATCLLTFDNAADLRHHQFRIHHQCEECGEVFRSVHRLENHMEIHDEDGLECVTCTRDFTSASGMIDHLEAGCRYGNWNEDYTQLALYKFAKYHPVDYGFHLSKTGPISCACEKVFHKASALCKHLESGTCQVHDEGDDVVNEFVGMLREGRWTYKRRGKINVEEKVSSWISRRLSSDGTRSEIDTRIVDDGERQNETAE